MMSEAVATAARGCKSLLDENERRAKYFKEGKIHKYCLKDTVWMERHHKDVLTRHRQQSRYVPGVLVRRIGRDVYPVQLGDNKILHQDHKQLQPLAPDPSRRAVTFGFNPGDLDSYDDVEEDDYTAKRILTGKPDPAWPGWRRYKVRWKEFAPLRDSWELPSSFVPRYTTVPGPRPAPGARKGPPHNGEPTPSTSHRTTALRNGKAGRSPTRGATSGIWWSGTHQLSRQHAQDPRDAKMTPAPPP